MDLYVERQCIDQMKQGNRNQFLLLFDANFEALYRYIARRVDNLAERERVVKLTFLDALGQMQNTPEDTGYVVWLYSLAKPRTWNYIDNNRATAAIASLEPLTSEDQTQQEVYERAQKMFQKLSLEEREIIKLKFLEEQTDGDVMVILGVDEGTIGSKIYRVLKRAHFLLFGESDERQGVYFGELSGFMERVKTIERIEIPEAVKIGLKAELSRKIEQRDMAIESEPVEEGPKDIPWVKKAGADAKGSNDPAKIFVEAVKEMREEEEINRMNEARKAEQREMVVEFLEKWRAVFIGLPVLLFLAVGGYVVFRLISLQEPPLNRPQDGERVARPVEIFCEEVDVEYEEAFTSEEKERLNRELVADLCEKEGVEKIALAKREDEIILVKVDLEEAFLEYVFAWEGQQVRLKKYAKTAYRDGKQREI